MSEEKKAPGAGGCLLLLLAPAVLEGGIVLIAVALHRLFVEPGTFAPAAAGTVAAGVLLAFAAPRLFMLVGRSGPQVTWGQAACALPDFALAGWFLFGWAAPHMIGEQAAGLLVGVMVLEFIIIHASVGLVAFPSQMAQQTRDAVWWKSRPAITAGLLLLYSLFAAGISAAFSSLWLFLGFWILFANKFLSDWLQPAAQAEARKQEHMARWGASAAFYLLFAMGSVFIPVPRLGASSASQGDGLWEQNPEQAVAMGAMYFAALGFCELYGGFRRVAPQVAVS
jgi:hypothetical protein